MVGDQTAVQALAFGMGILISAGEDRAIRSFRLANGEWIGGSATEPQTVLCTALSVGFGMVLSGFEDGAIAVWSAHAFLYTGASEFVPAPLHRVAFHQDTIWAVTKTENEFVTADGEGKIARWNVDNWVPVEVALGHTVTSCHQPTTRFQPFTKQPFRRLG